ncbi:MAG: signal peptidase I [Peptococcaceae bacterium]|nr:signal peptidase I [Peptococcaceae bacterium]
MGITQRIKKTAYAVLVGALLLILAANCYMMFARLVLHEQQPDVLGYSTAVVISGSMSGSIEINDMIIIHAEDTYTTGDVITFYSGHSLVTHRIVGETERGFITKGDANNAADLYPVPITDVVGKVVLVLPGIGVIVEALRTPLGMTVLLGIALCMILLPGRAEP